MAATSTPIAHQIENVTIDDIFTMYLVRSDEMATVKKSGKPTLNPHI